VLGDALKGQVHGFDAHNLPKAGLTVQPQQHAVIDLDGDVRLGVKPAL
jgi:hypothetical protein